MNRILPPDVECWQLLGQLGCLDTATIHRRNYTLLTLRGCQRRLRLAAEAGYLRRAPLAVCFARQVVSGAGVISRGGAVPVLHAITDKAADVVERETGVRPRRVLRSDPAAATFLHRWQVVLFRLALDDAVAAAGLESVDWVMEQDPWIEAPDGLPPNQRRLLYHRFGTAATSVTCQPDGASLLRIPAGAGRLPTELLGLWEIDRGSEGLKQIQRKLPGYEAYLKAEGWLRYFHDVQKPIARLFWIGSSAERVKQLRGAVANSAVASFCRFAIAAEVTSQTVLHAPIWQTTDGRRLTILQG